MQSSDPTSAGPANAGVRMVGGARVAPPRRRWRFSFDRESIDEFCERGILGSVLAILLFGPLATGATRPSQFLVLLGLGTVLSAFWLVRTWTRQQYRFLFPPFAWIVVAFTGYAIWRYTGADIEYVARLELFQVLLYAVVFFAIIDNLTSQENIQILLFSLIGLGMLNAFYAVFQYFTDSQSILWYAKPAIYKGRGSGTYVCPNHLSGLLELILPIALAYTITGRYKPLTKVFLGYAAIAMLAGIGVTISRGGYVAAGISLLAFFLVLLWNRDFRIPALAILILLLAGGSFFGFRSWQAQKRFADLEQTNMRVKYWDSAAKVWKENFWFGAGAGHYDWRFRPHRFWKLQGRPIYAHNDYLNTLADYGTVGGAIAGLGILALGWGVFRSWKYVRRSNEIATRTSNRSAVVLGCSAGLLAILAHSLVDFNMHIPGTAVVAVALMAILTSQIRFATERFWFNPGIAGRVMGSLLLLAAGAAFVWQIQRVGAQEYHLAKYAKAKTFQEQVAALKSAHAAEPMNSAVTLELGEIIRKKAWEGNEGWETLLGEAMPWYQKGMELNRWDPDNYMRMGMALHWLGEDERAGELFDKALALDPKCYYALAMYGWHRLQVDDLEGAKKYFTESRTYYWEDNPMAVNYLGLIERKLAERSETR